MSEGICTDADMSVVAEHGCASAHPGGQRHNTHLPPGDPAGLPSYPGTLPSFSWLAYTYIDRRLPFLFAGRVGAAGWMDILSLVLVTCRPTSHLSIHRLVATSSE